MSGQKLAQAPHPKRLNQDAQDRLDHEHDGDLLWTPPEVRAGEQGKAGQVAAEGKVAQERDGQRPAHERAPQQRDKYAERVEAGGERTPGATIDRQRLGQPDQDRNPVDDDQPGGGERREAEVVLTQKPAQGRPEQEAHTDRGAQQAKAVGALAWSADVGDVRLRRADVARRSPGHEACDVQHGQAAGSAKQEVADHFAGDADEQYRPPPVPIRAWPAAES